MHRERERETKCTIFTYGIIFFVKYNYMYKKLYNGISHDI